MSFSLPLPTCLMMFFKTWNSTFAAVDYENKNMSWTIPQATLWNFGDILSFAPPCKRNESKIVDPWPIIWWDYENLLWSYTEHYYIKILSIGHAQKICCILYRLCSQSFHSGLSHTGEIQHFHRNLDPLLQIHAEFLPSERFTAEIKHCCFWASHCSSMFFHSAS